ncbi:MAG: hypothetical protein Q8K30_02020 [Candidatus Gracilibacteria bacterium]|nr:hypothetical protein [Candidatus Gracilibacteria bacterium]
MNKNSILTIIILGIFLVNIFALKAFSFNVFGDYLYEKNDYINAIKYFNYAGNRESVYNKANAYYKQKKYEDSIKEYISILGNDSSQIDFSLNHNIANNFYRLGESKNDIEQKIKSREKSVDYYRNALNINYDEETKKNLEFVLKKLEEEKKKQENKQNEEKKDNQNNEEKSGTGSQDNTEEKKGQNANKSDNEKGSKESQQGEKSDEKNGQTDNKGLSEKSSDKQENKLTKEQSQALEQYEQALKQEQKNNSEGFNKVYQPKYNSNDIFDIFNNDPFFNNDLLNGNNGEKDW